MDLKPLSALLTSCTARPAKACTTDLHIVQGVEGRDQGKEGRRRTASVRGRGLPSLAPADATTPLVSPVTSAPSWRHLRQAAMPFCVTQGQVVLSVRSLARGRQTGSQQTHLPDTKASLHRCTGPPCA